MKKLFVTAVIGFSFAACDSATNETTTVNANDTINQTAIDSSRMLDSTTSGMDTARESYDLNSGK